MSRWFDSLFARMLLVQGALALLVAALFALFAMRQQAQTLARATAPVWAAALAAPQALALPSDVLVNSTIQLLPGPPPPDAVTLPVYPRFRALTDALRSQGVPVSSLRVSGRTGEAVTWLEIERGDRLQWVGVRGAFEGIDVRERGTIGLAIGFVATFLAAWWLSGRILRPVADLRAAMRQFEDTGELTAPATAGAPVELRELAQQFADLARQRRDLDEQRRTMLAAISHDLRSPLGRIRMAAELLPDAAGVSARREAIVRNVHVADRLLGSFIDMARADDEPISGRVDLCALVRCATDGEADYSVGRLPEPALWLQPASAVALERALRNLLDNARRHGAAPIELSLTSAKGVAVISIRDHGPGIAATAIQAMLLPFTRGESSRNTPGTGLGLAIAQRTAVRHGGSLVLSSAEPGLRASLHLPLQRS